MPKKDAVLKLKGYILFGQLELKNYTYLTFEMILKSEI